LSEFHANEVHIMKLNNTWKTFILAMVVSLTMITNCNSKKQNLENLSGVYSDPKPYSYGKAFGHRKFSFENQKWTLDFTLSLYPAGNIPVFTFRTYGKFKVINESTIVSNAWNAIFYEEKKFLTLKTEDKNLIQAFRFADCKLTLNEEKDISESGCSAWLPVSVCNEDHDLLMLTSEGGLHFGERPFDNNMCTSEKRPKTLTPPVFKSEGNI